MNGDLTASSVKVAQSPAHAAALKMAALGFPVFPLHGINEKGQCTCGAAHGRCKAGKHPRRLGSFKEATMDAGLINMWFMEKDINYGIRTGVEIKDSGKMLVVVDVDSYKEGGEHALESLISQYGALPDTAEVMSGAGGRHMFFLTEIGNNFSNKLCENVDFKGSGGYTVGPGSMHASGKRYDWEGSSDLFEGHEVAELPKWIVEQIRKPSIQEREQATPPATASSLTDIEVASVKRNLSDIPADDYDIWISVLMALKSLRADQQAYELAVEWSSKSAKYDGGQLRATWLSLKADGGIGIGTIERLAGEERVKGVDISKLLANLMAGLDSSEWRTPEMLKNPGVATAYPLHALPLIVRDAVVEVQQFVQAPMPMVACSALATLSLTAQSQFDVERASSLHGPLSLYFLVVADSGERKSSLDNYFAKPVAEYEKEQARLAEPLVSDYAADMAAWDAVKQGLTDRIKQKTKASENTDPTKAQLREHEAAKPARPVVARLIYSDTTPEALVRGIATEWPSAGLISSEGGAVFGGHGMSKDAQVRNMATINQLWDGKPIRTDRSTTASFTAEGRLTVAIQVQAPTLKAFFDGSNGLARGTGFLARFLITCPQSTQGTRKYIEPPTEWPLLERFRERLAYILKLPQPIQNGRLQPPMLHLSPEAKDAWVGFYNELELQLGDGGELHDVRDVASKTADNAVRLAALFHVAEDRSGDISKEHMVGAAEILRWHLNESQRVLNGVAVPLEMENAAKLNSWLCAKCVEQDVREFSMLDLMQRGPKPLRKKAVLEPVLETLTSLGHVKVVGENPRLVKVNPALLPQ